MTTVSPPDLVDGRWPVSPCGSDLCRAPIVWAHTEHGKTMPIDVDPHPDGRYRLVETGGPAPLAVYVRPPDAVRAREAGQQLRLHHSHYATCPAAPQFRRPR